MKKKILIMFMSAMLSVSVFGCGGSGESASSSNAPAASESSDSSESSEDVQEDNSQDDSAQETADQEKDIPDGDYSDMGSGEMYISTAGGTSEGGAVPVIFVQDEFLIQIGLDTTAFDGSKLSYIYIDGMLSTKEQLGDSQTSLDLSGDALQVGIHSVEVLQYDNDDPSGSVVTYKSASYEVKSK